MTRITVPFLDANIVDATVVAWHKAVGDQVSAGELIAEVSTDKAAYEIEAPASGELLAVFAPVKSLIPVKFILGLIGEKGETDPAADEFNNGCMAAYRADSIGVQSSAAPAPSASPSGVSSAPAAPSAAGRLRATPKARRLAQAKGLDLAEIAKATGAEMITEAVIEAFIGGR